MAGVIDNFKPCCPFVGDLDGVCWVKREFIWDTLIN